eukprot:CAMPEP_0197292110 /NCGR_PEP_ID=MMETSP0890-20130614/21212_1 /TAXON_ID=44058 ORGANISM="Aureoumbra lagunensis, Strain CCMP1510" /NCGR_SAMPLE_ID=MMETSP0890 /ASSEMBLY_ACC=CAM_ASM_000533 /LENGTH=189 /DNA_ID=CAMNT_0042765739 /DNA_START=183 /DNA_END=752 /DNA_ORIENTATION=+
MNTSSLYVDDFQESELTERLFITFYRASGLADVSWLIKMDVAAHAFLYDESAVVGIARTCIGKGNSPVFDGKAGAILEFALPPQPRLDRMSLVIQLRCCNFFLQDTILASGTVGKPVIDIADGQIHDFQLDPMGSLTISVRHEAPRLSQQLARGSSFDVSHLQQTIELESTRREASDISKVIPVLTPQT